LTGAEGTGATSSAGTGLTGAEGTGATSSTGSGSTHTHTFTGTSINLAVSYADVIIASKN
jgi:hypothetical protein